MVEARERIAELVGGFLDPPRHSPARTSEREDYNEKITTVLSGWILIFLIKSKTLGGTAPRWDAPSEKGGWSVEKTTLVYVRWVWEREGAAAPGQKISKIKN